MRERYSFSIGAGLGALTGLAVAGLAYLGQQALALPFIPFVLFDWLSRTLPGSLITLAIDSMVRLITGLGLGPIDAVAKGIEQFIGVVLWLAVGAITGVALVSWLRRQDAAGRLRPGTGRQAGAVAGLVQALIVVVAMLGLRQFSSGGAWTLVWLLLLLPGWGALLGTVLQQTEAITASPAGEVEPSVAEEGAKTTMTRRQFLVRVSRGSVLAALVAGGLGALLAEEKARTGAGRPLTELTAKASGPATPPAIQGASGAATAAPAGGQISLPPTPSGRAAPAPGTRPEVTSNADFYRIDIDLFPSRIDGRSWQLQANGLFDRPRNLALADLLAMPAVTQPITQGCISNPIGGDLISSAYYTGVRLVDVLKTLGPQPAAKALAIRSADGFYESVTMQDMQDPRVLLVYGMNGTALPVEHGYPLRIYIPDRYGMKQPKWITSIEAIDHDGPGYWVDRGWSQEARPQVISIVDTVAKESIANGRIPVGGIAWAGDRGIKSVEVQVDGGAWTAADLITPPLGPLMWVLWRYDWPATPGRHTFRVRATDGEGAVQNGQDQDTYPNGATGYHSVTASF